MGKKKEFDSTHFKAFVKSAQAVDARREAELKVFGLDRTSVLGKANHEVKSSTPPARMTTRKRSVRK